MNITCELYAQWIQAIRNEFSNSGFDHSGLNDQDCAIRWQSWKRRTVPAGSRQIVKANGFVCPANLQAGLSDFEQAISSGSELWPWQSKLIDRHVFEDGLYNDFQVVHFHMGQGFQSNGYIDRTGDLLFAIVDVHSVYEIGIYHHGDWYEFDLLDIIDQNWPVFLDRYTINGIDLQKYPTTRDEVKKLRQANVVSIFKLPSGRIVAPPGGGVSTDATSVDAVNAANYWAKLLRNGAKFIKDDIRKQVMSGTMADKDYEVFLHATDSEIAGFVDCYKWVLWKRA